MSENKADIEVMRDLTVFLMSAYPEYLSRQLGFIKKWGCKIVVLDGNAARSQKFDSINTTDDNFVYFHGESSIDRFNFAAQQPVTRFAMLMSDDDVFLRSGVLSAIRTLEANPSWGCVIGPAAGLGQDPYIPGFVGLYDIQSDQWSDVNGRINWKSCNPSPEFRVRQHAFPYASKVFYGVCRGDVLSVVFSVIGKFPKSPPAFANHLIEITLELLTLAIAPAGSSRVLYFLRSEERRLNEITRVSLSQNLREFDFFTEESGQATKDELQKILLQVLDNKEVSSYIVSAIFVDFVKNAKYSPLYQHHYGTKAVARRLLKNSLKKLTFTISKTRWQPNFLSRFLSRRFRRLYDTNTALNSVEKQGGKYNHQEITNILKEIEKWHTKRLVKVSSHQ